MKNIAGKGIKSVSGYSFKRGKFTQKLMFEVRE